MSRTSRLAWGLAAALVLVLVVIHWITGGVAFPLLVAGILVLLGGPVFLLLWDRVPVERPRRLPGVLWVGAGHLLVGFAAQWLSLSVTHGTALPSVVNNGPALHQVKISRSMRRDVADGLSDLTPRLALRGLGGTLLILSRLGRPDQRILLASLSGGTLQILNLSGNTLMGTGTPGQSVIPWATIRPHVGEPSGTHGFGPYRMAGTWVWIVPKTGAVYVVNGHTGEVTPG
jgi:CubicO group peptidase (beta-lactamase class C family)